MGIDQRTNAALIIAPHQLGPAERFVRRHIISLTKRRIGITQPVMAIKQGQQHGRIVQRRLQLAGDGALFW